MSAATSKLFASKRYAVCINYKSNRASAEAVASDIGLRVIVVLQSKRMFPVENDVVRLFKKTDAELGPLSVLVNNAGILRKQSRLVDLTAERINTILANNVTSYFLCCREAIKRMSTRVMAETEVLL
ncbi:SDR family NAD(P)-dependent oxidoreductase (plasmid) [Pseudoalteromonas espejiana]